MSFNLPHLRIGLTGGIGSGKSTVAQMLQARGAAVIDADVIARSVTAPQGEAIPAIVQTLGAEFITPEGALDRERMRAHVFENPKAKRLLETIIHPLVTKATQRQTQEAIDQGHRTLVFDVPLLLESGVRWRSQVDRVLVVDCLVETQTHRVMARNGWDRETVQRVIVAQASRAKRLAAADWVIHNEGLSMEDLRECVQSLPLQTT